MPSGYECDKCGVFVADSGYGGDGPKGEDCIDVEDSLMWLRVDRKGMGNALCFNCWEGYLRGLVRELQEHYL